jgi:hypothetical protein
MLLQHLPEANSIVSDWPKDRLLRPKDRINLSSKKYKIESESNLHEHELQAGGPRTSYLWREKLLKELMTNYVKNQAAPAFPII